jgi:hypothetical protein
MMRGANTLVYLLGLSLGISAHAVSAGDSPYKNIVERNVFGLKPPQGPTVEPPPPPPPAKITLTGITTLLGNKRALLSVQVPNKPLETFMLTEGQRDGEIEVLEIDEKAGTVKVVNHGVAQTLDFKIDGAKPVPVILPTGAAPGGLVVPTNSVPAPIRTIPTRSLRLPPIPGGPPAPGQSSGNPALPAP